ncbi:hypothetical protein LTR91_018703 [Friedmanniomyces endolithicus]|uniref:Uncharacterized protein n=1 Tax=Friedmanniomyces endolithicus TaxID=329885 RepID=A0AAN6HCD6_9PEZI|nr:hypothetical protein LTR91_018703 [Friedmanniomyces endolithicus]
MAVAVVTARFVTSKTSGNAWRNKVRDNVHVWGTNFEHARSKIPNEQLLDTPPGLEYVPLSPIESPERDVPRRNKHLHPVCTPSPGVWLDRSDPSNSPDSDTNAAAPRHKRNHSQVASSPPQPRATRFMSPQQGGCGQTQHTASPYCTQRCLLGLRLAGLLDDACSNVSDHREEQPSDKQLVTTVEMVHILREQLDKDVDHFCEPFGSCGASGAPSKFRCDSYGYTFIAEGTTSRLWSTVSREAQLYQILHTVQGYTVQGYTVQGYTVQGSAVRFSLG